VPGFGGERSVACRGLWLTRCAVGSGTLLPTGGCCAAEKATEWVTSTRLSPKKSLRCLERQPLQVAAAYRAPMQRFVTDEIDTSDAYKLLSGLIVPRPIGWIGTRSADGVNNLAPYSFFNGVAASPPTVMFAPTGQPMARKDTLSNARDTGVFTVNIVNFDLGPAMNTSSGSYPEDVDEFEVAGLTVREAELINAPIVAEAPASFECKVLKIVEIGEAPMGSQVVFGEVVAFNVEERLLDGTRVDQAALDPIGRHVGNLYSRGGELYELVRPD
jgi:flavin reductase (DIM6/NTAB) family NADH-FMN oxidoreductase RutF